MKKIFRIVKLSIFIFALISFIVWFSINKNKEKIVVDNSINDKYNLVTENLTQEKLDSELIFNYTSETNNDQIIFTVDNLDFKFDRKEESMETTLVVEDGQKTIFSKKYPNSVSSVSKISFNNKDIVLVNYYSGGAHCCSSVIPYLIEDKIIVEGKYLDLGNIDIFNGDTFFIKDERLFTSSTDDRFAYFEMDYGSSGEMFFPSYYELTINPLEFVNRNELFVNMYSKLYSNSQLEVKKIINKENCATDEFKKYPLFASLVSRYTNGFLSGVERDKLKSELSNDWWCFPDKDLNKIENDIYETLKENNKGDEFVNKRLDEGYKRASEINNDN